MNIAIVDVGSNNIKLEIHGLNPDGKSELIYADKIGARLGHNVFLSHQLAEENQKAAIEGMIYFASMIKSLQCEHVIAIGTAALRETHHESFVERVRKESGISIQVVSGVEEARLVFLGALAHTPFAGRRFLLVDIGGGSTEISVADEKEMAFVESFRLGTVRLTELFSGNDSGRFHLIENYVSKVLDPYHEDITSRQIDMGLLTGGTARNLMAIIASRKGGFEEDSGNAVLQTSDLEALISEMKKMPAKEIVKLPGLDRNRADIIMAGGLLLLTILNTFRISRSIVSERGLRDGVLADFIYRKINPDIFRNRQEQTRLYGLHQVSDRYNVEKGHAEQCAKLAIRLFDLLREEHRLGQDYRDLLFGAALLHDIGMYIDYSHHHKHSHYLILNSQLVGFSQQDKLIMAMVARYHRKSGPKPHHPDFTQLTENEKDAVRKLAAILRLADSLDRSYRSAVDDIRLDHSDTSSITLGISGEDLSLELWSVERKKGFFEKVFGKDLTVNRLSA